MINLCDLFGQWAQSNHICRWANPEKAWEGWARNQGWLRADQPASGMRCADCQKYCTVQHTRNATGQLVHHLPCEECGSIVIDESQLQRWRWDTQRLVSSLSSLCCPGHRIVELVPDQAWVLGKVTLSTARPQLVLFRSAMAMQHASVIQWQATNKSVIGFFPHARMLANWKGSGYEVGHILQVSELGLELSHEGSASLHESAPHTESSPKPTRKRRDERDRSIVLIFNHLVEYMRMKQDILKDNYQRRIAYTLLPCPKQKEIATAVGLKPPTVSKCLNDPNAESLQLLWKMAQSEDVVECLKYMVPSARLSEIEGQRDAALKQMGE